MRGGDTEPPQRTAPPIAEPGSVTPVAIRAHAIVTRPVGSHRRQREIQIVPGKTMHSCIRPGPATRHNECPCDIVEAISLIAPRFAVAGVLEQTMMIGQPLQMV